MANEVSRILRIIMRFEDIIVLTTKNAICRSIKLPGRDLPTLRRHLLPSSPKHPEDGSNMFLRNVNFFARVHGVTSQRKVQAVKGAVHFGDWVLSVTEREIAASTSNNRN